MTADMSVAPEIARLADTARPGPAHPPGSSHGGPGQPPPAPAPTLGALAGRLSELAATPQRWWGLVWFEPGRPVRIEVDADAAYRAWLVVLPPGHAGQDCDCDAATVIAGEVTEGPAGAAAGAALRPGPVRVHGQRHLLRGRGPGYSVTLHARARRPAGDHPGR